MRKRVLSIVLLLLMFSSSVFALFQGFLLSAPSNVQIVEGKNITEVQLKYLLGKGKTVVFFEYNKTSSYQPVYNSLKQLIANKSFEEQVVLVSFPSSVSNYKITIISVFGEVELTNVTTEELLDIICANLLKPTNYCITRKI